MASVVLVVDMVRGFCEEGHNLYVGPSIREIIPRIAELLRDEKDKGSHIIFVADTHDPDDKEFEVFPPHCIPFVALKSLKSSLNYGSSPTR